MKFYTYIIKSKIVKRYYVGSCSNIELRLERHNYRNSKSTKGYLPWEIVYFGEFESKSEAIKREYFIKKQMSVKFIEDLIHSRGRPPDESGGNLSLSQLKEQSVPCLLRIESKKNFKTYNF